MVIFIIKIHSPDSYIMSRFTFQYGYIYYPFVKWSIGLGKNIYIPIWLYLLCIRDIYRYILDLYLHSNMVIFIIIAYTTGYTNKKLFTFQYGYIYY